jgi:tetratricopeptide (TPR) repeat protein
MRSLLIIFFLSVCACFVQAQTGSEKRKSLEVQADTLFNRQDFAGALKLYNQVAELSKLKTKEDKGVLYKRSVCYYSIGDFEKALADINGFIPEYEAFPQAKLLRAFIYRELGDDEGQLKDLETLLSYNPMNKDLIKWKSAIYLGSDKFEEAKQQLLKVQQFATDEEIETQLGFAYYNLESPDSAFIHFENAMSLNAGYLPAYLYISTLCLDEEAYELALTYIDLALKLDAKNPNLFLYKGIALMEIKKSEEGCRYLTKAFQAGSEQAGDYLKQYCYTAKD